VKPARRPATRHSGREADVFRGVARRGSARADSRLARKFWIGAAALLGATALISIVAVLRGEFTDTDAKILGTLGSLLLAGGTAVAGREQLVLRRGADR
jgi:hypothetical protein